MKSTYEKLFLWAAATLVVGLGIVYATDIKLTSQTANQGDVITADWVNAVNMGLNTVGAAWLNADKCQVVNSVASCGAWLQKYGVPASISYSEGGMWGVMNVKPEWAEAAFHASFYCSPGNVNIPGDEAGIWLFYGGGNGVILRPGSSRSEVVENTWLVALCIK